MTMPNPNPTLDAGEVEQHARGLLAAEYEASGRAMFARMLRAGQTHEDMLEPLAVIEAIAKRALAAEERVKRLEEALITSSNIFADYARQHYAKQTREGDEKAERNHELALMCERALNPQE
jgi:hypothetical protein